MITYYQIITQDFEVKGTYQTFEKALANKEEGDSIRYWNGVGFTLNVTRPQE